MEKAPARAGGVARLRLGGYPTNYAVDAEGRALFGFRGYRKDLIEAAPAELLGGPAAE